MKKVVRIGTTKTSPNKRGSIYCSIKYKDECLSISGVIGPLPSGNALGSCGQIDMEFVHRDKDDDDSRYGDCLIKPEDINFASGWDKEKWLTFLDVWKRWHLNDMQVGCKHQRAKKWGQKKIQISNETRTSGWLYPSEHPDGVLMKPCPVCGYKYGLSWLKEDVPDGIIKFLESLPDTDKQPAWF